MFDEDSTRRAFRTLTDEPAPPVTTTVDQVLRRGRRRVFAQRAGATAGVMAVVAAIGVGTVVLRGGPAEDLQIADSTTPPATTTTSAGALPPGWREVPMPPGVDKSGENCLDMNAPTLPREPDLELLPEERVADAYRSAIVEVTGDQPVPVSSEWMANSPKHDSPRGYIVNEFPETGQLQLEAGRYGGTPAQIAEAMVTGYGNCEGPSRYVAEDGTVLQLYELDSIGPLVPIQHLQVYRPDNRFYIITSVGYVEADVKERSDGTSSITDGSGTLPTTPNELASIGLAMAAELR